MNIAYIIYREDIFSPLVEGQVLDNLYRIVDENTNVHIIWLKRIDYYIRFREKIGKVRKNLSDHGIALHEIPIIVGKFPLGKGMSDFVFKQTSGSIRRVIEKHHIDIIHTRGYNAGLLVTRLLERKEGICHVFDPRSPYLTEIVSTYGVKKTESKYLFWEKNEAEILEKATCTVAISEDFADYLRRKGAKVAVIPNNTNMEEPSVVQGRAEEQKRNSFCFVGSLGYGWNNVLEYISFMKKVWTIDPSIKLELYVLNRDVVVAELEKAGVEKNRYSIDTLPPAEVGKTISGCMAGLQIMASPDTRLGVKTVDYIAAGVPIICNSNAMGAARLVEKYNIGWNIDLLGMEEVLKRAKSIVNIKALCVDVAWNEFSTAVVSSEYKKIYKKL